MKLSKPIEVKDLRAMKPGDELADGASPGLRARCREKGVVWSLMTRDADGRRKRIDIGAWPETGVPQARRIAAEYKAATKRERITDTRVTLDDVIALYEKEGPALGMKSWDDGRNGLRCVFRALLDKPTHDLTPSKLQRIVDKHPSKNSAGKAVRYLRPMLRWAEKRAYCPKDLTTDIEEPTYARKRTRVLSADELGRVLPALGMTGHEGAMRMMLLTLGRREEVCSMRFEDIIEDVWFVPAETRKFGKAHVVPLSQQAQRVIGAQGRTSGLVFLSKHGKRLSNWERWQKGLYARTGTSGWHRHDLRRTAATLLGDNGVAPHIIEVCLGHTTLMSNLRSLGFNGELASVYNHSRYEKEHADALDLLGDVLQGIELRAKANAPA